MDSINYLDLHHKAPDFILREIDGVEHHLREYQGRIVVVYIWSAECPWAERGDRELLALKSAWGEQVVVAPVAVNSNETSADIRQAASAGGHSQIFFDPDHALVNLFGAQVTPQVFVLDRDGVLQYRGAIDDVTFRQKTARRHFLAEAVQALIENRQPPTAETPAYGCALVSQ